MFRELQTLVLVLFLVVALVPAVSAWDDCPRGLVNDTYPGLCSRYTDTNKDGICDHSQPEPATVDANLPASVESPLPAAAITAGTVPASTQKTPLTPLPVILVIVCGVMCLFRKRREEK